MLGPILDATRRRIAALDGEALRAGERTGGPVRDFAGALCGPRLGVIAEIKRRSPSAGPLAPDMDPVTQAEEYVAGGADAISVLTEPEFFDGSLGDLIAVRDAVSVPVLRKDFTLEPEQIWEARVAGADAVLLIVAILDDARLGVLLHTAKEAGLAALVETHTAAEAERAVKVGAEIVGVNNRDLMTFRTDLSTAETVAPHLGGSVEVRVAESGVSTIEGARRMATVGYDAILVGEALVRAADPAALVRRLRVAR